LQQGALIVRFSFLCAAALAAACFASFAGPSALAQSQKGTGVVVIDIKYIFENHARFKQQMEVMKRDAEEFQGYVRNEEKALRDKSEKLKEWKAGSKEYKELEEQIAQQASKLQVDTALKRKEFLEREAKAFFNTYNEICDRVGRFAEENGISLVLRFNSETINAEDRGSVMQGVNRAVVYQRNLDITLAVLEQCNRQQPAAAGGNPSSARAGQGAPGGTKKR
jgi:Skp family chaperone for outer membrane proteins